MTLSHFVYSKKKKPISGVSHLGHILLWLQRKIILLKILFISPFLTFLIWIWNSTYSDLGILFASGSKNQMAFNADVDLFFLFFLDVFLWNEKKKKCRLRSRRCDYSCWVPQSPVNEKLHIFKRLLFYFIKEEYL